MKKAALLIIFLLVFALTSFAQVEVTVTGKSELTLGIALDEPYASGFKNTHECKIAFTLAEGTADKGGEEDVHGWIEIKEWAVKGEHKHDTATDAEKWTLDSGDVKAKVMFSGGWVQISGTTSGFNFVLPVQDDDADPDNDDKGLNASLAKSGGIVLGLDFAPAAIEIGIFSENNWTQDNTTVDTEAVDAVAAIPAHYDWVDADNDETTAPTWELVPAVAEVPAIPATYEDDLNDEHAYGVSAKITLDMAPIKVEIGTAIGLNYVADADADSKRILVGGKVTADVAPIVAYAAADVEINGDVKNMEFGGGISVTAMDGVSIAADISSSNLDGSTLDNTDLKISVTEDGVGGAVPGLGASIAFMLFNMLATDDTDDAEAGIVDDGDAAAEYAVDVTLDYTITDTAKVYAGVRYGTYTVDDDEYTYLGEKQEQFKLNVGVDLIMVENVTFKVDYKSDDLTSDSKTNGLLKFVTTISY